jgi:hypothetical protein
MEIQIEKLEEISKQLNGIIGRMSMGIEIPAVKEAQQMTINIGVEIDELIEKNS